MSCIRRIGDVDLMYALIGTANLDADRADEAIAIAKGILANASAAAGFVSGTFARSPDGTAGRSLMVFDTEEAAQRVLETATGVIPAGGPTEIVSLGVYEVVENR